MALAGDFHTFPLREVLSWIALHGLTGTVQLHAPIHQEVADLPGRRAQRLVVQRSARDPRPGPGAPTPRRPRKRSSRRSSSRRRTGAAWARSWSRRGDSRRRSSSAPCARTPRSTSTTSSSGLTAASTSGTTSPPGRTSPGSPFPSASSSKRPGTGSRRGSAPRSASRRSEVTFKVLREGHEEDDPTERQILGLAAAGKTLAAISLETRRSGFETALLLADLCDRGALAVDEVTAFGESDPVGQIIGFIAKAEENLSQQRFDAALQYYERVLAVDGLNQMAKKGLIAVADGRKAARMRQVIALDKVPILLLGAGHPQPAEVRSPGGLRPLPDQRPVGRALDPQALPHAGGGGAHDLRPPGGPEGHRADVIRCYFSGELAAAGQVTGENSITVRAYSSTRIRPSWARRTLTCSSSSIGASCRVGTLA